jgi:hypothetical protein
MDIVFTKRTLIEAIKKATTICIQRVNHLGYFIKKALPVLTQPINFIITGIDQTFPNNTDARKDIGEYPENLNILFQHPSINKIFVENLDYACPKTFPIPLGINANRCPTESEYFLKYENINPKKPLKFTNFNLVRYDSIQWSERHYVNKLCTDYWSEHYVETHTKDKLKPLTHESYLKLLSEYMFTVCVHGGGLDPNPKLWEALLVGTIPIIRENKPHTDIYTDLDFPVVIVKDWHNKTITLQELKGWRNKYYHYFTDINKRKDMLYKLSADYWIDYVRYGG